MNHVYYVKIKILRISVENNQYHTLDFYN